MGKLSLLEMQKVSYQNEKKLILQEISLKVAAGDFISLVGPSGSGKSTILKLCCHLLSPTQGKILFKGKDIKQYNPLDLRRRIAYCAQTPYLFGETVEDNFSFPYLIRKQKIDLARVQTLLSRFNLDGKILKNRVQSLSGGEKQRIALIRTLLFKPEILLLDEVTSALDVANTELVEKEIYTLNQTGMTILWVTHSPEQSRKYANILLSLEQGKIKTREVLK